MQPIPDTLAEICGVAPGADASILIEAIAQGQTIALDGLLNLQENQQAALENIESANNYQIKIFESIISRAQPTFCRVNFQAITTPILIGSLGSALGSPGLETPLPTELEQLVLWCLLNPNLRIFDQTRLTPDGNVVDWRRYLQGKTIVAEPNELSNTQPAIHYVHSLFGLKTQQNVIAQAPLFSTTSASEILLDFSPNSITNSNARLMFEAACETNPKWRLFSLYRILENAYLDNIKNALISQFDSRPKLALKEASSQLASELMQLIALAESTDLRDECIQWDAAFENLLTTNNSYIDAIDREAREDHGIYGSPPNARYKKALLRLYKLRCSIAHAGTSSVIYEKHNDADQAAVELIPKTELIVFKLLKLQVTP